MGWEIQYHTEWRWGQEGVNGPHLGSFDRMYPLSQANEDVTWLCQGISNQINAWLLNLLTSTSFFFLVMLFFWSFSGWGAARLTGGLKQKSEEAQG